MFSGISEKIRHKRSKETHRHSRHHDNPETRINHVSADLMAPKNSRGFTTSLPTSTESTLLKNSEVPEKELLYDHKIISLPEQDDGPNKQLKRSSKVTLIEKTSEEENEFVKLELKSYASPANASAVIEVVPEDTESKDMADSPHYEAYNKLYYTSQYDPNIQYNQNNNGYVYGVPYGYPYVPSEEKVLSSSFVPNYSPNSIYYYPYPVQELNRDPKSTITPVLIDSFYANLGSKLASKPNEKIKSGIILQTVTNTQKGNIPGKINTVLTANKGNVRVNMISDSKQVVPSVSLESGFGSSSQSNYNVIKIVTPSYYLKTYPKLEWVPY